MTPQEKLELVHDLERQYDRLTPFGMAVIGFDLAERINKLRNDPDLDCLKQCSLHKIEEAEE